VNPANETETSQSWKRSAPRRRWRNPCGGKTIGTQSQAWPPWWSAFTLMLTAAVVLRVAVFSTYGGRFVDDAYILMQYAENLALGNGLVYNLGERVIGYSSPLYVVLLAVEKWLAGNLPFNSVVLAVNLLFFVVSCLLCAWLFRGHGVFRWLVCLLFCFYFPFVDATVNGMETMLMLMVVLAVLHTFQKGNIGTSYVLGTIACLVRPEGFLLLGSLVLVSVFSKNRRPSLVAVSACAGILLLWIVPTCVYFGCLLPQSVLAKSSLFAGEQWFGLPSGVLEKGVMLVFGISDQAYFALGTCLRAALWVGTIGAAIMFGAGCARAIRPRSEILVAGLVFLLTWVFYVVGNPLRIFSWYTIVPAMTCAMVVAVGAEGSIRGRVSSRVEVVVLSVAFLACVGTIVAGLPARVHGTKHAAVLYEKLCSDLERVAPEAASIMLSDIGFMGYRTKWRVVDLAGLVAPDVLRTGAGERVPYLGDLIAEEKPDVIYLKGDLLENETIMDGLRYKTFRDALSRERFLEEYSEPREFMHIPAHIFVRKRLLKAASDG